MKLIGTFGASILDTSELDRGLGEDNVRCYLTVDLYSDAPFWVSRSSFKSHFDRDDFRCREILDVTDAYLNDWFFKEEGGLLRFLIPPIGVYKGRTQFISGRHRTAVLLRHLEKIPLSFDTRMISSSDRHWVESVVDSPINLCVAVDLPDLPIRLRLP